MLEHFKYMVSVLALVASIAVFAANTDDMPFGYHSTGIDTYGDNKTPVLDGEYYALVWIATGAEFAGFKFDGTLVDEEKNDIVFLRPLAENGKCPPVDFVIPRLYRDEHPKGEYRVVLLDTRCREDELAARNADGSLPRVNGWGWANGTVSEREESAGRKGLGGYGAMTDIASLLPQDCRRPEITKFFFDADGNAVLEFKGSERYLSYLATKGATPATVGEEKGGELAEGAGDDDTPVTIVIPKAELAEGAAFFGIKAKTTEWTNKD